jgi:DNA-binding GntR family transcriptional regulator
VAGRVETEVFAFGIRQAFMRLVADRLLGVAGRGQATAKRHQQGEDERN